MSGVFRTFVIKPGIYAKACTFLARFMIFPAQISYQLSYDVDRGLMVSVVSIPYRGVACKF